MLAEMTWQQLMEWHAYAEVEPFGEERADLRAGIVASTVANVNIDSRKTKPFAPSDFMPSFGGEPHAGSRRKPLTDPGDWKKVKATLTSFGKAGAL